MFEGMWCHENFKAQTDSYFDSKNFSYENIKINPIFSWKIWKYETKYRTRPFLKLKLKDPEIVLKNNEELKFKKLSLLNNYQQILHMSTNKAAKDGENSKNRKAKGKINIIGDVKKGISKTIKVDF